MRANQAPSERSPVARAVGWLRAQWRTHPRLGMAVRSSLAAALAWIIATILPFAPAEQYPYYAPFGAVVATTLTLAGSIQKSVQTVAAIALGGGVAGIFGLLPLSSVIEVALVVAIAGGLAGLPVLGEMGSWVPTAAIFTLIIGYGDEGSFLGAYAGMTLLGAAVGVAVLAVLPPLPIAPARVAMDRVRRTLAQDLSDLADTVEYVDQREPDVLEKWGQRHSELPEQRAQMQSALAEMQAAVRGNPRMRRYAQSMQAVTEEGHALDRLTSMTRDLIDLLLLPGSTELEQSRDSFRDEVPRDNIGSALRSLAQGLDPTGDPDDDTPPSQHARAALEDARAASQRTDSEILLDSVLGNLSRAASALQHTARPGRRA